MPVVSSDVEAQLGDVGQLGVDADSTQDGNVHCAGHS